MRRRVNHVIASREGLIGRVTASGLRITADAVFVALPSRIALWQTVVVVHDHHAVIAPVLDLGPWFVDDPYWLQSATRPRAEGLTGADNGPAQTNGAGIDLSDGLVRELDVEPDQWGLRRVLWWVI